MLHFLLYNISQIEEFFIGFPKPAMEQYLIISKEMGQKFFRALKDKVER